MYGETSEGTVRNEILRVSRIGSGPQKTHPQRISNHHFSLPSEASTCLCDLHIIIAASLPLLAGRRVDRWYPCGWREAKRPRAGGGRFPAGIVGPARTLEIGARREPRSISASGTRLFYISKSKTQTWCPAEGQKGMGGGPRRRRPPGRRPRLPQRQLPWTPSSSGAT